MKDKDLVTLKCADCGNDFTLSYGRYRRLEKGAPVRCHDCWKKFKSESYKERYENMTDEEKAAWAQRSADAAKNRSPEKREAMKKKMSESNKLRYQNMTPDKREQIRQSIIDGLSNIPEERRAEINKKNSESKKKLWNSFSYEEKIERMQSLFEGSNKFWSNASDDEKAKVFSKISEGLYRYYDKHDPKDNPERWKNVGITQKKIWDTLSYDDKVNKMSRIWHSGNSIGPTEITFVKDLENCGLSKGVNVINCYSTDGSTDGKQFVHPKFFDVFGKINPITKSENFPFHRWDFRIYSKHGNDILIDLDGSIHNDKLKDYRPANLNYNIRESIQYNDSKRPYQIPQDCDAYVIECHNDVLTPDTKVLNLKDGSRTTYKEFLTLLSFTKYTEKEIKDYLKSINK